MRTTVRRDRWGIAHVESPNVAQAFEAQGWIAASDRIQSTWEMGRGSWTWSPEGGRIFSTDRTWEHCSSRLGCAEL